MKRVLFICVHNSGRSQMAEAFLNRLGEGKFKAESAGFEPRPVNPYVMKVMAELDYDLSGCESKDVISFFKAGRLFDHVITVCDDADDDRCPIFPGIVKRQHWPFRDPASAAGSDEEKLTEIRETRDAIRARIEAFIAEPDA